MRSLLRLIVYIPLGLIFLFFALANRQPVRISLNPSGGELSGPSFEASLFLVVLAAMALGVMRRLQQLAESSPGAANGKRGASGGCASHGRDRTPSRSEPGEPALFLREERRRDKKNLIGALAKSRVEIGAHPQYE